MATASIPPSRAPGHRPLRARAGKGACFVVIFSLLPLLIASGKEPHAPKPSPTAAASSGPSPSPSPSPNPSQTLATPPASTAQLTDAQIDELLNHRNEEPSARKALQAARDRLTRNPQDAQAGWRGAMAAYIVGFKFTVGKEQQEAREALFREGTRLAEASIEADPRCGPCHFWAGVNTALVGDSVGAFKMLSSIGRIQRFAEKAAELDPQHAGGGPYRLLGQLEEGLPGILGGSDRRAQEWFEKAIAAAPSDPINFPYLIRIMKKRGQDEAARKVLERAIALPEPGPFQHESRMAVEEIRQLAREMGSTR